MKQIHTVVLDVDGTLTDGGIIIDNEGRESKRFCVKDGLGIVWAQKQGVQFMILTGRQSACVQKRAEELGIAHIYQGVADKRALLEEYLRRQDIPADALCYIGDDWNDLAAMELAGVAACPADAAEEVKAVCQVVATRPGGHGAVREILEQLLAGRGKDGSD